MAIYTRQVHKEYPFPQADSLDRMFDALSFICEGKAKRDDGDIAQYLGVHIRQARFYAGALAFLGLARDSGGYWLPTPLGRGVNDATTLKAMGMIAEQLTKISIFSEAIVHEREFDEPPSVETLRVWIMNENPRLNEETATRRAHTVVSWVQKFRDFLPPPCGEDARGPGMSMAA